MTASYSMAFPNGVSAGAVTQNSAVFWTRAVEPGRLRLQVATDPLFSRIVETRNIHVADGDVPVKLELNHLKSGTNYYYRFIDASGDIINGSFQTPAALGTPTGFHFGVISDLHGADYAPFVPIRNAAAAGLDLLVKLGDQVFADQPPPGASTLAEFRAEHQAIYSEKLGVNYLADLQATTPILSVPDDAELINNWAGGAAPGTDPRFAGQGGNFINQTNLYANALQAFREYNAVATRNYHHTGDDRFDGAPDLYRYQTYGSDAAVFMLDARSFRDAELPSPLNPLDPAQVAPFLSAAFDPGRTLVGNVQLQRLKQDLLDARDHGTTWKFVMLPEPIQNYGPLVDAGDRYEGYAAERAALLAFIDENHIDNVVFVSGDTHWYSVNNLTYQKFAGGPQIASSAFEVVVPSVGGDLIGPLVAPTAAAFGLIDAAQLAFYNSLPNAPDPDNLLNDKDDFNEFILDTVLAAGGYDPLGLDNNLAVANGKINATLLQGAYFVSHDFGWSDFQIDETTGKLEVTTWGVPGYSAAELSASPAAILALIPAVVSQFEVTPSTGSIRGTSRADRLVGTGADDVILGAAGSDRLKGEKGNDYLDGGKGDDVVEGGDGQDVIHGRTGNDWLYGNSGNDIISGGEGRDTLCGGGGSDTFVFAPAFGRDTIADFDADPFRGQDVIDISEFDVAAQDFAARVKISDLGVQVRIVIDANPDQTIHLMGVGDAGAVTQADFIL